jgi:opine dehydrogenase
MIRSIAILGAGHGGYAAAADLTRLGFDVVLQSRNPARLDPIRERGGIEMHGLHERLVPVKGLTPSVAEAVAGSDLIMLVVPSPAVGDYARELAPLMTPQHTVLINPGHTGGGLHFVNALRQAGYHGDVRTAETVTLTYICRSTGPATVSLYSYTKSLAFAAFPGRHAQVLFGTIRQIYPQLELATSVLETALANINATFHPPGMLMNAGWIEHSRGEFLFYHEGITESVARVIDAIDSERMAVAEALDVPRQSFVDSFYRAGLTTREAMESGDIALACRESAPNRAVKSPPSLRHRYIYEDVGYGLVPMAALGRLARVATPAMDLMIDLANLAIAADLRRNGLTLEKMGLQSKAPRDLPRFLAEGE